MSEEQSYQEKIDYFIEKEIAFMGSDWEKNPDHPDAKQKPHTMAGYIYKGEKPDVNCNDFFWWGCGDGEDINIDTIDEFEKAIIDCNGNEDIGSLLYCARRRKFRPQGAYYSSIPRDLWWLFHACGEKRKTGFGNPYKPGEYES